MASDESESVGLLAEIARRYFIEHETQDTIGRALGVNRMKVNRLLREAQDRGLVEIRVRFHSSQTREIEQEFCDRFGLKNLLVAPDAQSAELRRSNVAMLVSTYLESNLKENSVVAVGMGRNVAAVAAVQTNRTFQSINFVCGSGGASEAGEEGNADHICRALARRYGGTATTLYSPAFVPDADLREALMQHETIRRTMNLARSADFALIGIGDLGPDSHMARMGWFTEDEFKRAQASGVVGDLMGYDFFDRAGAPCNAEIGGRVIGLSRDDLRRISTTIALASEPSKVTAMLGALRTGSINILATTLSNCLSVLELAKKDK